MDILKTNCTPGNVFPFSEAHASIAERNDCHEKNLQLLSFIATARFGGQW
jgi:hypothetical protein